MKPCPFCGSTDLIVGRTFDHSREIYAVRCPRCNIRGPEGVREPPVRTLEEEHGRAIAAWNQRPDFDYPSMIARYMDAVGRAEGVLFLDGFEGTDAERAEMERISYLPVEKP